MGINDVSFSSGSELPVPAQGGQQIATAKPLDHVGYQNEEGFDLNVATLTRILWEWRWLILSAFAAGIAISTILTLLTPPLYRAASTVELNPPRIDPVESTRGDRITVQGNDPAFVPTQLGLLRSRALAERVAQDLNLAGEVKGGRLSNNQRREAATGMVAGGMDVTLVPQSRLIRITYEGRDPNLAARIVNGYTDAYINSSLERRYQSSSYARQFLERQIAIVKRDLENTERAVVKYAQSQGIITSASKEGENPGDTSSLQGSSLVAVNTAFTEAQTRRFAAEQKYRASLRAGLTSDVNSSIAPLRQQLAALQSDYEDKRHVYRPDYPDMVRLKSRIDSLNKQIAQEGSTFRSAQSGTLKADYLAALSEENELRNRLGQLRGQVMDLRGRSIEYTILQRDVDTNRQLYEGLLQRYKEIGVASGIGQSSASIVDRAEVPKQPFSPRISLNLLIGAVLGLVSGIATALALEFLNDTIKTPDDVRSKLQLTFLGGIPDTGKGRKPIEELRDGTSSIAEAYLSTATALQFTTETGAPKTLLVTSTRPAEGKSTSTWALAQNYARLGKRVLLIDADMRKPAFKTDSDAEEGLSNLLTNSNRVLDHVLLTEVDGLWLLPCGPIPPSPAELLASPRLGAVLAEASAHFDIVVVDGPPILGLADAPLLSSVVRATLLVVEAGKTRTRPAIEAHNRLRAAGAHVIGCILTRYRQQAAYGYGYGYAYQYQAYQYRASDNRDRQIRLAVRRDA